MKSIQVKVKPSSRVSTLEELPDGTWVARVRAAPIEGRANEELIALVARHFGVGRTRVSLRSGASGRTKIVRIDD